MSGNTVKTGRGQENKYYKCTGKNVQRTCKARMIPKAEFEASVIQDAIDNLMTKENIAYMCSEIQRTEEGQFGEMIKKRDELDRQISSAQRKIDNVTEAISESGHSKALLSRLSALKLDIQEIGRQKVELERQIASIKPIPADLQSAMSKTLTAALLSASVDTQRVALHSFIERIVVQRQENKIVGMVYYYLLNPDDFKSGIMPMDMSHRSGLVFTHNINYGLKILYTHAGKLQTAIS